MPTSTRKPRKRALLVGINLYPHPADRLSGCVNDAIMMGHILVNNFGFKPGADMRLLVDQRATKKAILTRLEWLLDGARPGDVLVFTYSGHGSQIPDRSGDELDQTDECLVPYDHDWDDPLLDEDLGNIIQRLPSGVNLTIVLDCCHSGTGTREFGPRVPAKKKRILPPPDIQFRAVETIEIKDGFDADSVTMTDFRHLKLQRIGQSVEENHGILITGCRADQTSKEAVIDGDHHGALTYALYQSLQKFGGGLTYADWHQSAAALIPTYQISNQDPQLECLGELAQWQLFTTQPISAVAPGRGFRTRAAQPHVVYVHGICRHDAGYSDGWWRAMKPYTPDIPDENRHEVIWSDIVTPGTRDITTLSEDEHECKKRIVDTLQDRALRAAVEIAPDDEEGFTSRSGGSRAILGIPGVDCIDDFMKYLLNDRIRRKVIDRFMDVVKPLIKNGAQLEIISHSWGTVVAYEALRLLDEDDQVPRDIVHNFFTVGSALSIKPVQHLLIEEAEDGRRPRCVETWVNLDAKNDIVGGPLKGVPFEVDYERLNLEAVGCWPPIFNWSCAHSSYFHHNNKVVQRDIFARHIND